MFGFGRFRQCVFVIYIRIRRVAHGYTFLVNADGYVDLVDTAGPVDKYTSTRTSVNSHSQTAGQEKHYYIVNIILPVS